MTLADVSDADVMIVGGGAAGLMAAAWCGRTASTGTGPSRRIVVLEGARSLGAKILVAGGGRCNVTHDVVTEDDFSGSSPKAIRKILRRFDVPRVIEFFADLGVELVREEGGKLFPATNRARSVLDALLRAARDAGAEIRFPRRVSDLVPRSDGTFEARGEWGSLRAPRVILCAGGRSLPKSGSDGSGLELAQRLGHSLSPLIVPALVPLVLDPASPLRQLAGLASDATVEVHSGTGRRLARFEGAVLCTHFGVSGPAILDVSRHWLHARAADPGATLVVNWLPGQSAESLDAELLALRKGSPGRFLAQRIPERLARTLCGLAGGDASAPASSWTREQRRELVAQGTGMRLPVTSDRGYTFAEATAGGVPLAEMRLETLESRRMPGLFMAGEILDVDGRIGGYNFQWAWASGFVAGSAA